MTLASGEGAVRWAKLVEQGSDLPDIIPDIALGGRVAQQVGGMPGGHDLNAAILVKAATELSNGGFRSENRLGGHRPKAADNFRPDAFELPEQERRTGGDLVLFWRAIARRTTLHDVADVHLLSGELNSLDNLGEQLPRSPYERQALKIFISPRSLTYEDESGLRSTGAKDDVGSSGAKFAAPTVT